MAKLNFGRLDYLPNRRDIGIGDVKTEYRRLKSIAQKRLKNIKNSEFANTKTYRYYNQLFGKGHGSIRGKTETELRIMLYRLQQFVSNPRNTVSGLRRNMRSTIKEVNDYFGEEILNKNNYDEYIEFINDKSMEAIFALIPSDQVINLWAFRSKGIPTSMIHDHWNTMLKKEREIHDFINERRSQGKKIKYKEIQVIIGN